MSSVHDLRRSSLMARLAPGEMHTPTRLLLLVDLAVGAMMAERATGMLLGQHVAPALALQVVGAWSGDLVLLFALYLVAYGLAPRTPVVQPEVDVEAARRMTVYSPVPITGDWAEKRRFGRFIEVEGADEPAESADANVSRLRQYVIAAATAALGAILVGTTIAAICASIFMSMSHMRFAWARMFELGTEGVTNSLQWIGVPLSDALSAIAAALVPSLALTGVRQAVRRHKAARVVAIALSVLAATSLICRVGPHVVEAGDNFALDFVTSLVRSGRTPTAIVVADADDFYGHSNIDQPLLGEDIRQARSTPARHFIHVVFESASAEAFPFRRSYCDTRGCSDISDADAASLTPNLAAFAKQSLDARSMTSFTSYSNKADLGAECGTYPHQRAWTDEHRLSPKLPCLPELLRTLDPDFATAQFTAGENSWDHLRPMLTDVVGYEHEESAGNITAAGLECHQLSGLMCTESDILPLLERWLDEQLKLGKRILLNWTTINLHFDYFAPASYNKVYVKSRVVNRYLNSLKFTDDVFGMFLDILRKRDLLDSSLIAVRGDHSDHISYKPDDWNLMGPHLPIYRVPLFLRFPGGRVARQLPRAARELSSLDFMPSVLDALGVAPQIIAPYVGRSVLRERSAEGDRTLVVTESPGNVTPMYLEQGLLLAQMNGGNVQYCAVNTTADPMQTDPLCFIVPPGDDDWRAKIPSARPEFVPFITRAFERIVQHLSLNDAYWSAEQLPANRRSRAEHLDLAARLAADGRAFA